MNNPVKRALISVDDPAGIVEFAISLKELGWHIIASAETVERLKRQDIVVEDVATFTGVTENYGFPPTLHPKMEVALTLDVPFRVDLVYDVPYPSNEGNDVGGRTLLALGAKGGRIVVFTPEDMKKVIRELGKDRDHATISDDYRKHLIDKANAHIAEHFLGLARRDGEGLYDGAIGKSILRLANGENPYQVPADLFTSECQDNLSLHNFQSLTGSVPCFTNLADTDCILHALCLAAEAFKLRQKKIPYIAIAAKHGNPCGMAVDWNSREKAIQKALFGNPLAIWGGEFIVNFKITGESAKLLHESRERKEKFDSVSWMLDVIAAPDFDKKSIEILGKRPERKLLKNPSLCEPKLPDSGWHYRQVRGGFLRQPLPDYILDVTKTKLDEQVLDSLIIAWCVAYGSNQGGNEVALARDNRLLGVGGGPSTVEAAETAVLRAHERGHDTKNSVFAADAFFPFIDAPAVLSKAGCRCGVVPSGGKNEKLVKKYFRDNNINTMYIPPQYRGFIRH